MNKVSKFIYTAPTAGTTVELIGINSNVELNESGTTIERMIIANVDTEDVSLSLLLDDDAGDTHYLFRSATVPIGSAWDVFDGIPFTYSSKYALKIIPGVGHNTQVFINIL